MVGVDTGGGVVVVMVEVGRQDSRSGLSWVQRLQVKGWAGVPSLQRRQVKAAAEVSVVAQSLQMKGCRLGPITHCLQ